MADAIAEPARKGDPRTAERAAESANPSPILITYDVTESDDERKARIKAGKPAATYSFTVEGYRNG